MIELPPAGQEVTLGELVKLALDHNKNDLLMRLRVNPPQSTFISDGCSMWPDEWFTLDGLTINRISIYPACFWHDVRYWCGLPGDDLARLKADAQLMLDVAEIGGIELAEIMFVGVRAGGSEHFKTPFRWGYGR